MTKSKSIILFFTFITIFFGNSSHPFYFGWVEVQVKSQRIQIHLKVFSEDLEACLRKKHPNMDILNDSLNKTSGILAEYVKKNFSVNFGTAEIPILWDGLRLEEEMCHIFLSGDLPSNAPTKIKIRCTLLFDGIPNQTHILKFKNEKISQTFFLNVSKPVIEVDSN